MRLTRPCTIGLLLVLLSACNQADPAAAAAATPATDDATPSRANTGAAYGAGLPAGANAMDCAKATTATERAICADPVLVQLDADLGTAWQAALSRTDDRDALLADQREWLARRDACIGHLSQRGCLRGLYAIRNAVLGAVKGRPFAWGGKWARIRGEAGFTLTPATDGKTFTFSLDAASGGHTGSIEQARATPDGARALQVASTDGGAACRLTLRRVANQVELVEVDSADDCGAAMGVVFAGRYVREANQVPALAWTLLTLDLADTEAVDAKVRAMLGDQGYRKLVESCQMVSREDDTPGLATCGVRGLYTLMEGALQQQGETVRVGLIDEDEVHWWTNDPATVGAPPAWFDAWRTQFADKPVRLMSMPGTPLLQAGARGD